MPDNLLDLNDDDARDWLRQFDLTDEEIEQLVEDCQYPMREFNAEEQDYIWQHMDSITDIVGGPGNITLTFRLVFARYPEPPYPDDPFAFVRSLFMELDCDDLR